MKRHPYADLGLIIAIGLFIITLINAFLFDFTIVKALWLVVCIAYFVLSHNFPSDSKQLRNITHGFLSVAVLGLIAMILFDTNTQPKAHAFDGAAVDSTDVEDIILEDKDIPMAAEVDTLSDDSTEAIDFFADSITTVIGDSTQHQSSQPTTTESVE